MFELKRRFACAEVKRACVAFIGVVRARSGHASRSSTPTGSGGPAATAGRPPSVA